jgi:hypothetical protein
MQVTAAMEEMAGNTIYLEPVLITQAVAGDAVGI